MKFDTEDLSLVFILYVLAFGAGQNVSLILMGNYNSCKYMDEGKNDKRFVRGKSADDNRNEIYCPHRLL